MSKQNCKQSQLGTIFLDHISATKTFQTHPPFQIYLRFLFKWKKVSDLSREIVTPLIKEKILEELNTQTYTITADGYSKSDFKLFGISINYYSPSLKFPVSFAFCLKYCINNSGTENLF